jgi:hypothetical protein
MNKTFVLVHGSWHGGWAWSDVIRELTARGHCAYAPTLPGHGPGAYRRGITIKTVLMQSLPKSNGTAWKA